MADNQIRPDNGSDETERVSSNKLSLMLQERGIPIPGRPAPFASTTSSGATNPFTSRELEDMHGQGRIGSALPQSDPAVAPSVVPEIVHESAPPLQPSIRIIIDAVRKLAVIQYKKDLGVTIKASTAAEQGLALHCRLSFDPAADRIVIVNHYGKSVVAEPLDQESSVQPTKQAIQLKPFLVEMLESGAWAICTLSGHQLLHLSILPRRNITLLRTPDQGIGLTVSGIERPYEASQPTTGEARRIKANEDEDADDQANIVFQPAPKVVDAQAEPQLGPAPTPEDVVLGLGHPFEDLQAGDIAKIIGPDGEDYTLSYDKRISIRRNSHVFTAHSSNIPAELMVVKVIQSPSGPVAQGKSRQVAEKVRRTGELWLKEVKIHAKLSQHPSVVRLYDHDARFLALYMENIDAPALDRYPCYNMTPADQTRVIHDMSTTLYYINQQGFVHNDIKPGNILFSRARGAVLIDFGLSSELTDRTICVVMLYVLGHLPLPERHPAKLQWNIAESLHGGSEAAAAMDSWLRIVRDAAGGVGASSLENLVKGMVAIDPARRVTLERLVEESLGAVNTRKGDSA
ncbi:CAMK protein kinase [Chaetomium sp. MPI-SDFR-AT-0129]|nr:CAMK protein kinase [Chaetomium sp. MPI-SDFR-AT-0129]